MKILIVEDDLSHAKLAHVVLAHGGSSVRHAAAAPEAMQEIAIEPPDAILLDLNLPGLNGLELARRLKANPATRQIAIVACTAYSDSYPERRARDAGCDGFVVKPIDMRTLPARLQSAIAALR